MSDNGVGSLNSKRVLVTGSSTGIGRAIAVALGEAGARVVLHGRSISDELKSTAKRIEESGGQTTCVACDFSSGEHDLESRLTEFADECWAAWGGIDILVNNAGGDVLTGAAAEWSFEEQLRYVLEVDVMGTLLLSRIFGAQMLQQCSKDNSTEQAQGSCSIVNVGWDQAAQGMAGDNGEMFATSKGAIMAMTRSLAQSLAPQVRVNCVAPGWIQTQWGEGASDAWQQRAMSESLMQRWGKPEDVASLVTFLVSDQASFVSGQIIPVNGGFKYSSD